jgi:hypothetical protein
MSKTDKKLLVIKTRKAGKSIKDISALFKLSKSTVSKWVSDIKLTETQKRKLYLKMVKSGHKGRMIGAEMNKQKKLDKISHYKKLATEEIGDLSKRDLSLLVTALFWAEGSKTDSRFIFINSDPSMIKLVYDFLVLEFKIPKDRIKINIQINESHKDRMSKILSFWSDLLKLHHSQIGKPYYVKTIHKKVYVNHDNYYGIVRLKVTKSSELFYKIWGMVSEVRGKYMSM